MPFSSAVATSLLRRSLSLFFYSISFLSSSTDFFLVSYWAVTKARSYRNLKTLVLFLAYKAFSCSTFLLWASNILLYFLFNASSLFISSLRSLILLIFSSSLFYSLILDVFSRLFFLSWSRSLCWSSLISSFFF